MSGYVQGLAHRVQFDGCGPTAKLILVRLADACNDEGRGAWPLGKARLARQCGGISEAAVKRHLRQLRSVGLITYADGERGGRGIAAIYSIDVGRLIELIPDEDLPARLRPKKGVRSRPPLAEAKGGHPATKRGSRACRKGVAGDPPYVNVNSKHARARAREDAPRPAPGDGDQADRRAGPDADAPGAPDAIFTKVRDAFAYQCGDGFAVSYIDPATVTESDETGAITITGATHWAAEKLGNQHAFELAQRFKRRVIVARPDGSVVRDVDLGGVGTGPRP